MGSIVPMPFHNPGPLERLDELDKDEWLLVVRELVPDMTEPEYDRMWQGFCDMKAEHEREKGLH